MPCNSPLVVNVRGVDTPVPCRWCMGCRIDRRNEWSNRIRWDMYELQKQGYRSSFVTLTYNEDYYKGGVCKGDIQKFNKRLREHLSRNNDIRNLKKFKFYAVSELGDNTNRGHYHIIYLGLESNFLKKFIPKAWRFGIFTCTPLTPGRINYTLSYMDKQIFGTDQTKYGPDDVVRIPFSLKSKGIGEGYLKQHINDSLESGVLWSSGHYVKFPSYYAKKFGVDRAILNDKMLKDLEKKALYNGMSVDEYTKQRNVVNEKKLVSQARNSGNLVDTKYLRTAESYLYKGNQGEKIAEELNHVDE